METRGVRVASRVDGVSGVILDGGEKEPSVSVAEEVATAIARRERSDKGTHQLTSRDVAVLSWIGEQYAARFDTLQKLLGRLAGAGGYAQAEAGKIAERNVRRIISRWREMGLVKHKKYLYSEPAWVWLTHKGLREVGLAYRLYTPSAATLTHLHLVNELRLRLENRYGERMGWKSERRLRLEFEQLSEEERTRRHLSDADVTLDGTLIGIEVELTQKSAPRVEAIIRRLAIQYPAVWYFVNEATEPVIKRAIGTHEKKIRVYNLSEVLP